MNKWRFIGLKSVFFILCMLGFSQVQAVDGINTLISKLNSIKSLDCHFVQTVSSKNATISKTSGQILLSRPGRFRWETREPSAQLIVADGQNLWIYDKELEQVIVKAQAKSLGAAFQKVNFLRDFRADYEGLERIYFPGCNFNNFSEKDKLEIERDIQKDFDHAFEGIQKLPVKARFGVYVAFKYYLSLFKKIKKIQPQKIMQQRIRIPDYGKFFILAKAGIRSQMNML